RNEQSYTPIHLKFLLEMAVFGAAPLGPQPVLLSNGHGWTNVTRFASLSLARLADSQQKAKLSGALAIMRCVGRIEEEQKKHSLLHLRQRAAAEKVYAAKRKADDTLRKWLA
ncbi:unnamed protein product, partial [Effrenium voratum]